MMGLLMLGTFLLHATGVTVCAFGSHHHSFVTGRQATSHFQKTTQAALFAADPTKSQSISSSPTSSGPPFRIKHIDHVVIRCENFPLMFDFYHRVLGCTIDEPRDDHVNRFGGSLTHLRAGSCYIDLLAYDTNHLTEEGQEAVARMHAGGAGLVNKSLADVNLSSESSTLDHLCLRIDLFDEQKMINYLEEDNVDIVTAGEKRLGADGVGPSVYVRDPEGNVIELKGSPYRDNDACNAKNNQNDKSIRGTIRNPGNHDGEDNELQSNDTQQKSLPPKALAKSSNTPRTPMTPCNRICRYNSSFYDGQVCIGCFREAYEIEMWQSMTPSQKSMTLVDAMDRCSDKFHDGEMVKFDGAVTMEELTQQYEHWSDLAKKK